MKFYLSILCIFFFLSACSNSSNEHLEQNHQYIFTAIGYAPIKAQSGKSFDIKILNAIKASKIEAYKEMTEQIYGAVVDAESRVDGALISGDKIEAKVKGVVRGARVLRSYHEGDLYITELELNMQTSSFLQANERDQRGVSIIKVEEAVYY